MNEDHIAAFNFDFLLFFLLIISTGCFFTLSVLLDTLPCIDFPQKPRLPRHCPPVGSPRGGAFRAAPLFPLSEGRRATHALVCFQLTCCLPCTRHSPVLFDQLLTEHAARRRGGDEAAGEHAVDGFRGSHRRARLSPETTSPAASLSSRSSTRWGFSCSISISTQ